MQDLASALKNVQQPHEDLGHKADELKEKIRAAFENPLGSAKSLAGSLITEVTPALGSVGLALGVAGAAGTVLGGILMELGQHATEVGAEIERVAMVSNVSASRVSDLKFAFDATGGSIEQLNTAMFMFEKRMETSGDSVDKGLHLIGLSLHDIEGMGTDEQLLAISDAFRTSGDDVNRAAAAFEIFGKQGRDMLPQLMQDLSGLTEKSKEIGNTWSGEDAEAAHKFEIAVKTMAAETASAWVQLGREMAPETNDIALGWDRMKLAVANVALTAGDAMAAIALFGDTLEALNPNAETSAAAMERLGGELPKIFGQVNDEIDKQKHKIDDLKESIAATKRGFEEYWKVTGSAPTSLAEALANQAEAQRDLDSETQKHIDLAKKQQDAIDAVKASLEGDTKNIKNEIAALDQLIASGIRDEDVKTRAIEMITKLEDKHVTLTDRIYKWDSAQRQLLDSTNKSSVELERYNAAVALVAETGAKFLSVARSTMDGLYGIGVALPVARFSDLHSVLTGIDDATGMIASTDIPIYDLLSGRIDSQVEIDARWKKSLDEVNQSAKSLGDQLQDSLIGSLESLPKTLEHAFEGKGGLSGALKSLGTQMGADFGKALNDSIKASVNYEGGGESGQGATGSGLVSAGALGGLAAAGTAANGGGAGAQLGSAALASAGIATAAITAGATAASAAALGAATMGIGAAVVGVIALIRSMGPSAQELDGRKVEANLEKQFGSFQNMLNAVGAAYAATGRGAQQAQADVKALMDAETQGGAATQAMVDKINSAFTEQKQDAADLDAAIKKYGFTIDQLGPTMQKQDLDGQAKQLIVDWTALEKSGINVVTVDQKMASSTWDYLQMAKKTGQEVPEAMKPVIQSMLDQGVFTDENGQKITEMKDLGITFSKTMTEGFQSVVDKLNTLIDRIGQVPNALGNIKPIPAPWANWPAPPSLPDYGGGGGPIPMAAGGSFRVTRPTLFLAGEAGDEDVAFSGGGKSFRGTGGGVTVNVTVEGNVSTERDLATAIQSHMMDDLRSRGMQFNLRGQ